MSVDLSEALALAEDLARQAGEIIKKAWSPKRHVAEYKDPTDLVTAVDKECEALILAGIRAKYPSHVIVAEEDVASGSERGEKLDEEGGPSWMVDPLDGTANFVHRIPFVSVAIGLSIGGKCVVGVVYNPMLDEMFTGRQGGGAFLNGEAISVSDTKDLQSAMVGIASGQGAAQVVSGAQVEFSSRMSTVIKHCRSWRRCGSAALDVAYVACGRLDLYMERGPHAWDVGAGVAILTEAGGVATGIDGSQLDVCSGHIMVANATLGPLFLKTLEEDVAAAAEKQ